MQPIVLADQIRQGVADFLATSFPATTPSFDGLMERFLATPGSLVKGPYVTVALPFRDAAGGPWFQWLPGGFTPYAHQARAWERLDGGAARCTLVATGTGSGKTEAFLYPILEHCRRQRAEGHPRGVKAILVYPMNALATDQAGRLAELILDHPDLKGIRAGLYVGEKPETAAYTVERRADGACSIITDRETLRRDPPDILLTNYKMLDFLLIRARDASLWEQNDPKTLRYLVVDELHTFDGAQGTDLACLIRRLKARLNTPEGHLACVGTSATLGDGGTEHLLAFASDVFGEAFGEDAVIGEDRLSVGEYLVDSPVDYIDIPDPGDPLLNAEAHPSPEAYIAALHRLWFGEDADPAAVGSSAFRLQLGDRLKHHVSFQNLLRDLHKLGGRSVLLETVAGVSARRRRGAEAGGPEAAHRWLAALLSLIVHAERPLGGRTAPLLHVRVELWLRELRRMVARLSPDPALVHSDDLSPRADGIHLPAVHCRDCHAMGWGAVIRKSNSRHLQPDLPGFYRAFFGYDVATRFVFPASGGGGPRKPTLQRQGVCFACGAVHPADAQACAECGATTLMAVDMAANLKQATRNGAALTVSHHNCPYCGGDNTLTIVGSQAASLASVMIGQLFGSHYNADKKLIAFSDSVQDAAHRAGFFSARTWRLNFRPALAQTVLGHGGPEPLTLATLPAAFEARWKSALGEPGYIASFLPPQLAWLRDYETLLQTGDVPPGSDLASRMTRAMTWTILAEFGQDAHIGRSLPRTRTISIAPDAQRFGAAVRSVTRALREEMSDLSTVEEEAVRTFLFGFVEQMARRGAIWGEGLGTYARHGCNPFAYGRYSPEFALLSVARRPHFLTGRPHGECDALMGKSERFYADWAIRCLPVLNVALGSETLVHQVYDIALKGLASAGLTRCATCGDGGEDHPVWGLEPGGLLVFAGASAWRCETCRHELVSAPDATLADSPCRRNGCTGRYRADTANRQRFYRDLYERADIARVVAREHTGLLPRETREALEKDFKRDGDRPGGVNLLSATPTLEMGIDIGDLSAVLLCSVPPAQANYLQRVGRAGRKTGTGLMLTVAIGRAHDLYFWEEPSEMLAGDVDSPGIYLNASAVLGRQLTAFTLDCWVAAKKSEARIPDRLGRVLPAVRQAKATAFPYTWLTYAEENKADLLTRFVALFRLGAMPLEDTTRAWLQRFMEGAQDQTGSFSWKVLDRMCATLGDIAELKRRLKHVDREIARLKALPAPGESDTANLAEADQERAALQKLMASIEQKDTLNYFTDEGLLPNYAFPEQGVILHSVIVRERKRGSASAGGKVLTFDYERPGVSAITELAPNSTFYAEGRRVAIDQVDVSRTKPEQWRFCRQCSYSESIGAGDLHERCPRCDDSMWSDRGRVRDMLRLTRVFARTLDSESRIADDADERARRFFVRQALVDVAPQDVREAYVVDRPEFPFGFEFLNRVNFREINFGEQAPDGLAMMIAGQDAPRPGFQICKDCGTVQRRRKSGEEWKNHALYCPRRKDADAPSEELIFLYREFESEGIRLFLPDGVFVGSDQNIHSFIAALQLGLEERFRGAVDHLRIARDVRLAQGQETPRQFLVIYDSVPGGTGYLKQLMRDPNPLFEVFDAALRVLDACACNADEQRDGCYRCLYAYRNNFDRPNVSREAAKRLLREITRQRSALQSVSHIEPGRFTNSMFGSELERRFIEALSRHPEGDDRRITVRPAIVHGKPGYALSAGERQWLVEPQVEVGPEEGVVTPSCPDFVLWPDKPDGLLPIAIFLDGWQFHKGIVDHDLDKRVALARSLRFQVWTLTWEDVMAVNGETDAPTASVWPHLVGPTEPGGPAEGAYRAFGVLDFARHHLRQPFAQLREILFGLPSDTAIRIACVLAIRLATQAGDADAFDQLQTSPAARRLSDAAAFTGPTRTARRHAWTSCDTLFTVGAATCPEQLASLREAPHQRAAQPLVLIRWRDSATAEDSERRARWRDLWRVANLLLPLTNTWWVSDAGGNPSVLNGAPAYASGPAQSGVWLEVSDLAAREVQTLVSEIAAKGCIPPEVGYELADGAGRIVAEAELAWPDARTAVLLDMRFRSDFEAQGWAVFLADNVDVSDVVASLSKGE